jgi:hypothetical protein
VGRGPKTLELIEAAPSKAGVEFIDETGGGAGVRLKKPPKKHLIGQGRYQPDIRRLVESCDLRFFYETNPIRIGRPALPTQSVKNRPDVVRAVISAAWRRMRGS